MLGAVRLPLPADPAGQARARAGRLTGHAAGETENGPDVKVPLLTDSAVLAPGEDEVWSEVICARLAELRPALYGGPDPTGLATSLAAYGITTKQIWGRTADGKKANRRGVTRADVLTAISSGSPLDHSGPASTPDGPAASGNGTGSVLAPWPSPCADLAFRESRRDRWR
jgi:hypothetical protein